MASDMRTACGILVCALWMPSVVFAQVVITEIMYDLRDGPDGGREWIEVYNASAANITLITWKVVENDRNHKISAVQGAFTPGTYAIIADNAAKFQADHPTFSGTLFDSAFSLNNDGERIALVDSSGRDVDNVVYTKSMGGAGSGDSLQLTDTGFLPGMPTPGEGVPAEGLTPTPQPQKAGKVRANNQPAAAAVPEVVGERPNAQREFPSMEIDDEGVSLALWLLGPAALAVCAAAGTVYARRVRKTEWDIIEET